LDLYSYGQSRQLAKQALTYRTIRQDMISSNLANVNTPYYRPKDINFEDAMAREKAKIFKQKEEMPLTETHGYHFKDFGFEDYSKPEIFFRDGHMARNDGNSVDVDIESTEMSKNNIMYNALINGLKKDSMIMRTVIESSGKV
jgi:flagellar basal-body rod protein FlgB